EHEFDFPCEHGRVRRRRQRRRAQHGVLDRTVQQRVAAAVHDTRLDDLTARYLRHAHRAAGSFRPILRLLPILLDLARDRRDVDPEQALAFGRLLALALLPQLLLALALGFFLAPALGLLPLPLGLGLLLAAALFL